MSVVSFHERLQDVLHVGQVYEPPAILIERYEPDYIFRNPPPRGTFWIEARNRRHLYNVSPPTLHPRTLRLYRAQLRKKIKPDSDYQMYLIIRSKANTDAD